MTQHINDAGLEIIKKFEGLRMEAYLCPAGKPTIGYGHTRGVKLGQRLRDEAHAEELLKEDVKYAEMAVNRCIDVPLNDNQFSALVSFALNLGEGALRNGTIPAKIRNGNFIGAAETMKQYILANGKPLDGLRRRRNAEADLFMSRPS